MCTSARLTEIAVVWRVSWPRIVCTVGRLMPFCRAVVANACHRSTVPQSSRGGENQAYGWSRLFTEEKMSCACAPLSGSNYSRRAQGGVYRSAAACGSDLRQHADFGLCAVRAAITLDPKLALPPDDVLPGERRSLDAEPECRSKVQTTSPAAVRGLARVGQTIGRFDGERFPHVLIRHLSPPKSCVLRVRRREFLREHTHVGPTI